MGSITAAVIQTNSSDDWRENLSVALELMKKARDEVAAEIFVLPENFLCFGAKGLSDLSKHRDEALSALKRVSDEHQVAIIAGSIPQAVTSESDSESVKYFSRCHFISPEAEGFSYDKIHLFDVNVSDSQGQYRESDQYEPGHSPVVASFKSHKVGLSICYDLRFPELYTILREQGAEMLAVPAAFTAVTGEAHWEILLRARAVETQCFVLAANQCGLHGSKRETWGHSMIVDPWGKVLAECDQSVGYASAELNLSILDDIRKKMPVINHRRLKT